MQSPAYAIGMNKSLFPPFGKLAQAAVCLLWLLSTDAYGQKEGTIAGTVIEKETGKPIPSANVLLRGTSRGTATDSVGRFEFRIPADERHILAFSHIAYVKEWYEVEIKEGERMDVTVELRPTFVSLNDYTVWGTPKGEDFLATHVIREEDIERLGPLTFEDLLLRSYPQIRWRSAMAIFQRRPDYVLYVDGMPWDPKFLNQVDPYTVRTVIIFRSVYAPVYYRTGPSRYVVDVRTRR